MIKRFAVTLLFITFSVGSLFSQERNLQGPGVSLPRLGWSTMGFDEFGHLYVLTLPTVRPRDWGEYQIVRWPLDGRPFELIAPINTSCNIQDTRHGIHIVADTFYVLTKCLGTETGQVWVSVNGATYRDVAKFDDRGKWDFWFINAEGFLIRLIRDDVFSQIWTRVIYSSIGEQSRDQIVFADTTRLHKDRPTVSASGVVSLTNDKILCFAQAAFSSHAEDIEMLGEGYNKRRYQLPRRWLISWVLDFGSESITRQDITSLEESSFGSVDGWLGRPSYEIIARDSNVVSILIEGWTPLRYAVENSESDSPRLYLLRFDSDGILLDPSNEKSFPGLKAAEGRISSPTKQILRLIPDILLGHGGEFRLIELDDKARISISDYRIKN